MQLRLPWAVPRQTTGARRELHVAGRVFPVEIRRRRGTRRFVIRVTADAVLRITVPYGASVASGLAFATRQEDWIARQWARHEQRNAPWAPGAMTWFRGERVPVEVLDGRIRIGGDDAGPAAPDADLRAAVLARMRSVADAELPAQCLVLAGAAGIAVDRISVRNQRTRWAACSARRAITLNWRLVQIPPSVRDYVIHHELAHLTVPNHSPRFWREVEGLCPSWRDSERWLKAHERDIF